MGFSCGIVGLPNAGKSTLFNALTATAAAQAEAYPFSTIEPNTGRVAVTDPRLERIAAVAKSARLVHARLEFVDIAGLVRGASKGEGLGNQFLAHIREVDAISHVVRCFAEETVPHPEGTVDPVRDAEIVETELMLADLESLEKRLEPTAKRARGGDRDERESLLILERAVAALNEGKPARSLLLSVDEFPTFQRLHLLTAKPVLYVCNVDEASAAGGNEHSRALAKWARADHGKVVVISARIEAEIAQLEDAGEREEFLASLGLGETGLSRVVRAGYGLLDLITFFTANEREAHAWTVRRGTRAVDAAAAVHTDFARGFISAETIASEDYVACGGEHGAREAGKLRTEGKDYRVRDGDVILFRFHP